MSGPFLGIARALARLLDVRPGEGMAAAGAFVALLLIIAGHTILETARDALLLAQLPPASLASVYLAIAALTLPAVAGSTRLVARLGARRALVGTLIVAGGGSAILFLLPASTTSVLALYIASGLIGAVLVPQFWALAGRLFTVSQGRRLLGPIASAGVLGGLVGSGAAAAVLSVVPVQSLVALAGLVFVGAAGVVAAMHGDQRAVTEPPYNTLRTPLQAFRDEPFLTRIALLVALSTAALLVVDYLFKWTVAHAVPAENLGRFFARYYTVLNGLSLLAQLFVGGAIVRRLGVAAAIAVTPFLILIGGIGTLVAGGALAAVLLVKGVDGSLRHSVHRITTEIVYLPVPHGARERAKPFIDGTLARGAQALTAGALLALAEARLLSASLLAAIAVGLAVAWFVAAATVRRSYLALFRRTLSAGAVDPGGPDDIDVTSAEVLVERLASREPSHVIAAMRILARRGRDRLISALVLYHRDESVLAEALKIFDESSRSDWIPLAEPLLDHPGERVRIAAVEALGNHGRVDLLERLVDDPSPRVRGYVIAHLTLRDQRAELLDDPRIAEALDAEGEGSDACRLGILSAIADAPPTARLQGVLVAFARDAKLMGSPEYDEPLALAAARHRDALMIPLLIDRLPRGRGREAIREALLSLGEPAFRAVWEALRDPHRDRRVRVHLPRALARFGTQQAADRLLELIETESDGLVRYKAIRGLGQVVAANRNVRVDRRRIERLAYRNLVEHFRILGLSVPLRSVPVRLRPTDPRRAGATGRLLVGLLDDKLHQSLERTFRLLKIAHRREDFHGVHAATLSNDPRARANASEFIDTLLGRRDQQPLRELLRIVTDDLDGAERVRRAAAHVERAAPQSHGEAVLALLDDPDLTVAAIANAHAVALGDDAFRQAVSEARRARPGLQERLARLFEIPAATAEPANAGG